MCTSFFRSVVQTRHCSSCCHQTDRNRWVHGLIDNVVGHCRLLLLSFDLILLLQPRPKSPRTRQRATLLSPKHFQYTEIIQFLSQVSCSIFIPFLYPKGTSDLEECLRPFHWRQTVTGSWSFFFFFFKGAILPLTLGLIITAFLLLLFIIGCRIRLVRHKIRKARPLTTEESDYLINGMYL